MSRLIIQMQRLGDIILTFPLIRKLNRSGADQSQDQNSGQNQNLRQNLQTLIMAEESFYKEILPISPACIFVPSDRADLIKNYEFSQIINLSSANSATLLTGQLNARQKLGLMQKEQNLHIAGFWHLYRAALTQNNHLNRFHWADLFLLDLAKDANETLALLRTSAFSALNWQKQGLIGLVLGASIKAKRPSTEFWVDLAIKLARSGLKCIFLGGKAEAELGQVVAKEAKMPLSNYCGKLNISQLAKVMRSLSLCITPDTGPMHLADHLGVPVLNLSLGPVQAWETGPRSPGHFILRAKKSCVGCWECKRAKLYCHQPFQPTIIAKCVLKILEKSSQLANPLIDNLELGLNLPCLSLLQTRRDCHGLYQLYPLLIREQENLAKHGQELLATFWQKAMLCLWQKNLMKNNSQLEIGDLENLAKNAAKALAEKLPKLHQNLIKSLKEWQLTLIRQKAKNGNLDEIWQAEAPLLRLFAGWQIMSLQNQNYSALALAEILEDAQYVGNLLKLN